ncbi:hypothetical protein E1265_32230 [Streptomyces sp. 8K308]|uniref:hypothetical protein n=1 Tax=Streptomyces sp. 8K308 TaxID=2530388 RepID=UPI0010514DB7|nr:hypothetical protein [Streptomyces sp. 8K308]TDC09410.1 hypothetical protein E1265_32230 [Streptomyces sp. 8K308]
MTDIERLIAIAARAKALPASANHWRQRDTDAGLIEDADGHPIAVLGTSGDVYLPEGVFLAHAPRDMRWLLQQYTQMREALNELWDRIDDAGSLMSTDYVQGAIERTLPDTDRIRAWARANGHQIGDQELIPKFIRLAYRESNHPQRSLP